jgi:hypothetical protein
MKLENILLLFALHCILLITAMPLRGQNPEPLDSLETNLYLSLRDMQWQKALNNQQLEQVRQAISSTKDVLALEALKVVYVHQLQNRFSNSLEKGAGPSWGYSPVIGKVLLNASKSTAAPEKSVRQSSGEKAIVQQADPDQVKEIVTSMLVLQKARQLRSGEKSSISIPETDLTPFHKLVLKYSVLPDEEAIKDILGKLTQASVAGAEEYDLVEVLNTYGEKGVGENVEQITDLAALKKTTKYGRLLLINHLSDNSRLFRQQDKAALVDFLARKEIQTAYFESPVSLREQVVLLLNRLQ